MKDNIIVYYVINIFKILLFENISFKKKNYLYLYKAYYLKIYKIII